MVKRKTSGKALGMLIALIVLVLLQGESALAAPAKVKNFRLVCNGNKSAFLGWDEVKKAQYYNLYRYMPSDQSYKLIQRTKETSYQAKGMKVDTKYYFVVRSVVKGKESADSNIVEAKGKKINVDAVHGRYWSVSIRNNITVRNLKNGKKMKVKAGTSAIADSARGDAVKVKLKNGARFSARTSDLKFINLSITPNYKYYSRAQAEAYINGLGLDSDTGWLIWISQYTGSVHIFQGSRGKWKRMRVAECVIGEVGHTSPGQFRIRDCNMRGRNGKPELHFSWNPEKEWGQAFHCRIDSHTHGAYSDGCVRLGDSDLYYLAGNCPVGTTVWSH